MYAVLFACSTLISIDSNFNEIAKNIIQLFRARSFNNNFRGSKAFNINVFTLQVSYTVEKIFLSELYIKVKKEY
jgi:hypothetical protein